MEFKTTEASDKGEVSPFSRYCLNYLPPLGGTFGAQATQYIIPMEVERSDTDYSPRILYQAPTAWLQQPQPQPSAPQVSCGCKKSKCLKLYCDCFAKKTYCTQECGCTNCMNKPTAEEQRKEAIEMTLERHPGAFRSTFDTYRSCHCKKSACRKKYCECFQQGKPCTFHCRCEGCQNTASM